MNFAERTQVFAEVLDNAVFSGANGEVWQQTDGLKRGIDLLNQAASGDQQVFVLGNGGSAAVASHIVNDFVNNGRLKAHTLHDPALLTCMTNDYGYENAYARILRTQARRGDLLIAISSSGQSGNILEAVRAMDQAGGETMTLSGFRGDNPLRRAGGLNCWLDKQDYGLVEIGHLFVLHYLIDSFKKAREGEF